MTRERGRRSRMAERSDSPSVGGSKTAKAALTRDFTDPNEEEKERKEKENAEKKVKLVMKVSELRDYATDKRKWLWRRLKGGGGGREEPVPKKKKVKTTMPQDGGAGEAVKRKAKGGREFKFFQGSLCRGSHVRTKSGGQVPRAG